MPMDALDYWRLCDELSVIQAALLVAGCDPSRDAAHVETRDAEQRYEAAKTAIANALRRRDIVGLLVPRYEEDTHRHVLREIDGSIDLDRSRIEVKSLRTWLAARGIKSGFFFPSGGDAPDYLNSFHPRYAPKLAAAVKAWLAVESESLAPKDALAKWLRQHAAEYELTKKDGKLNEMGIEEIAKVANWQRSGGAPKTPAS